MTKDTTRKRTKQQDAADDDTPSGSDDEDFAPPEAKKKKEGPPEYGVDSAAFEQSGELTQKYSALKVDELKARLKANRMHGSGVKSALVARCVDGEMWGALPACPRCKVAKLKVAYRSLQGHNGQGDWTCRGSWDKDLGTLVPCFFRAAPGGMTRDLWRDADDPAPEPEAAGAGSSAASAASEFARGFEAFDRKAAAAELLRVARERKFQMPSSEQQAKMECGTKLMATRDEETDEWDGPAALAALREDHAPMSTEEAAGGPAAACEANGALASCLDKLARLEKQAKGDAGSAGVFKIRAYVAAAAAIRDLAYEVESGKACSKAGPKKVKGIGQGIGDMIDEFLETGTLARISELEGGGSDAA